MLRPYFLFSKVAEQSHTQKVTNIFPTNAIISLLAVSIGTFAFLVALLGITAPEVM
jgi:hypothetical protein